MRLILAIAAVFAPALFAAAAGEERSASAGERAYQKCYSCHALESGRNDLEGPTLYGVVGRGIAAEPGFEYSPALRRFAERHPVWTEQLLDRFAADPESFIPGTSMAFAGMRDPAERAALIAYLKRAREVSKLTQR